MIRPDLLERLACPVCLEPEGCASCARPPGGHAECLADYARRAACSCGGPDKRRLLADPGGLRCPCCGVVYPIHAAAGYVDLVPRTASGDVTLYADHEFHERLGVTDTPPLLSARVKADMMWRMLAPEADEEVLDLGSGAGKLALYLESRGARAVGLDVAPFFLPRAARTVALVLGDLRRIPLRKAAVRRACSLDVLEHLDEDGVREVLVEARRTLGPDGRLFVYTHAMESSRLAGFQRAVNRLARRLGEAGFIDHEREALRKSDHRNAIRSHEHFEALCAAAGLEVQERRYYNVVLKAVVEDLLLRLYEQRRRHRLAASARAEKDQAAAAPRSAPAETTATHPPALPAAAAPGRLTLALALGLSWLLKLDVVLFGGIRTGPFFALLRPRRP